MTSKRIWKSKRISAKLLKSWLTRKIVVSAFHQLQKLHQEFRDTGPVAKELRDEIWNRFKAASTAVNRRHQQHFESLKEAEQHNLDQKDRHL